MISNPIIQHARKRPSSACEALGDKTELIAEDSQTDEHFSTAHLLGNLKRRTISSGVVTGIAQACQFLLTLISTMILARLLAPNDFGLLAMATTVVGFLKVFKDAGLSTATVQREGITHAQVSNLFWVNFALSSLVCLMVAGLAPAIAWFYREPKLLKITLLLSLTFVFEGSAVQHMALLNRQMRFNVIVLIQVGSLLAGVVVGIVMAMLKCGYWSLVGFQLTTPLTISLLAWTASRWRPQFPARRSGTWPLLSFGVNLTASSLIWSLARGADTLLIGRAYGSQSVGLYSRAAGLLHRPLEQFLGPFNTVFVPALCRLCANPKRYRSTFLRVYEAIALVTFLLGGLFFALAHPITLVVLGPKWEAAAPIFAGFAIAALFNPLCSAISWLFSSQGRGSDWVITSIVVSGVTVCSFLCGLPFGPAGVAFVYSVSGVLLVLPIMAFLAGRAGPVSATDLCLTLLRHAPVGLIASCAPLLMRRLVWKLDPLAQLAACGPVGLLTGLAFISLSPPSRRVAADLFTLLREWSKARSNRRT